MKGRLLFPCHCILGEGPLWHSRWNTCYWVDIENYKLYELDWITHESRSWTFPRKPSAVVEGRDDKLILAFQGGIARFDPEDGKVESIVDLEKHETENRTNDGKCDSAGRLWIGTMHKDHRKGAGALYAIDSNLVVQKKIGEVSISNGLAWTADNTRMYFIDSPTQTIQCYLFDEITGAISFEKVVINVPPDMGTPDGMTIDTEGMLWVAHWGGFGVYRWNPHSGKLLEKIELPVPNVSSCTFAGESLDHLIITTASEHMSEDEMIKYPESGNLFIAQTQSQGFPANKCIL